MVVVSFEVSLALVPILMLVMPCKQRKINVLGAHCAVPWTNVNVLSMMEPRKI